MVATITYRPTRMPPADFLRRRDRLLEMVHARHSQPLSPYIKEDRMLLTLGLSKKECPPRGYAGNLGPFIIELYAAILDKSIAKVPPGFWQRDQGLQNLLILGRHVLEEKCGLEMGENGSQIDPQLFPENQPAFLARWVEAEDKTWQRLLVETRLMPGIRSVGLTQQQFLKLLWPKAFDLSKPAGEHLDPWWFKEKHSWEKARRSRIAATIRHTLEVHFDLRMDRAAKSIDPRLFNDGAKDYLEAQDCRDWSALGDKAGIFAMLAAVPYYQNSLILALRSIYAWAFNLRAEEGKHLHFWQIFSHGSTLWIDPKDIITAVRHEALAHDNIPLNELPRRFTVEWLRTKGLGALLHQSSLIDLLRLCFNGEITRGRVKLEEIDYTTDNYKKMDSRGRVIIDKIRYCFPAGTHQLLVKRIIANRIGLFAVERKGDRRIFVLKYKLATATATSTESWKMVKLSDLSAV